MEMVKCEDLMQEWIDLSDPWIKESREGKNPTRNGLLDHYVLEACGDVSGLNVLDCGCGEGRFCRIMAEKGAMNVTGIDLCGPMIEAAKALQSHKEEYFRADAQSLSFLKDCSFDLAVSYLNQCDLPDFSANNREIFRVLKPGGRFVVANLHPMRTAVGCWLKDAEGKKQHVVLDCYFEEGVRRWTMMKVKFTNFHRTLATYVNGFIRAGFSVECIAEPTVTPENLKLYPDLDDELRVPTFIVYVLKKN